MISSAKMHKAEGVLRRLQPFRQCVQTVIGNLLSSDAAVSSPLTAVRPAIRHAAIVVLGSDDGLCGAYNVNIFKGLLGTIEELRKDAGIIIKAYVRQHQPVDAGTLEHCLLGSPRAQRIDQSRLIGAHHPRHHPRHPRRG